MPSMRRMQIEGIVECYNSARQHDLPEAAEQHVMDMAGKSETTFDSHTIATGLRIARRREKEEAK